MAQFSRKEIKNRLYEKIRGFQPIIVGGAGLGIIAKTANRAGIDLIMAYNTGPFRMDGLVSFLGYLPYGNCNEITVEMADRILRGVNDTPVIAGVGVADRNIRFERYVDKMIDLGYSGITNVPTASGAWSGPFRTQLEANGYGFEKELELIRYCDRQDIFSVAYTFDIEQVRRMVGAGVDIISPHVGGTSGGMIGFSDAVSMDEAIDKINEQYEAAIAENPDIIVLGHGGPLESPEMVQCLFDRSMVHGFIGASSFERIPVEKALVDTVHRFRETRIPNHKEARI